MVNNLLKLKLVAQRLKIKYDPNLVLSIDSAITTLTSISIVIFSMIIGFFNIIDDRITICFFVIMLAMMEIFFLVCISKSKIEIEKKIKVYTETFAFYTFYESLIHEEIERRKKLHTLKSRQRKDFILKRHRK